jgi:undecaprenyl-diphosphatase
MDRIDEAILLSLAEWRRPWLNRAMMDLSSLGSPSIVILISVTAFCVLYLTRNRWGATKIVAAAGGAEIWLEILKRIIERPRPAVVPYLVEFSSFSFPSGHALSATATYAAIAAVACMYVQERRARIAIWWICSLVIAMVAVSRVYLGVHYPTDVAGGVLMGLAWFYVIGYVWRLFGVNLAAKT